MFIDPNVAVGGLGIVTLKHNELRVEEEIKGNPVKKLKEISLMKVDLTLTPEDFGLEGREDSSTLGY